MTGDVGRKAVMVCGAGHSGSTLLGMILGSHSAAFYMGEGGKARYLHDEKKPMRKRVCKICGADCPVWSTFRWDRSRALYAQVAQHVAAEIIVDTTKDEAWIEARTAEFAAAGGQACLLLLTRDGRAVVNSRIRKYPERDPETQILDWKAKMERSQALFDAFEGPKTVVRYEDLAVDTEREVRRVCDVIGVEYEPGMLDFSATPHHVLGGNSGTQYIVARERFENPDAAFVSLNSRTRDYYRDHSGGIELDLRWKTELAPVHEALFDRLAGGINESMKWEA